MSVNMTNNDFVSYKEIAEMLGIGMLWTRANVTKRPDFPKPVINVSQRIRKWSRTDVINWIKKSSK